MFQNREKTMTSRRKFLTSAGLVGAGALVPEGKVIPERSLAVGSPARVIRTLTDEDVAGIERIARHYVERARRYRVELRVQE